MLRGTTIDELRSQGATNATQDILYAGGATATVYEAVERHSAGSDWSGGNHVALKVSLATRIQPQQLSSF